MEDFVKKCLEEHNEYRRLHGVPPLRLNLHLSCSAQDYADQLVHLDGTPHSDLAMSAEVGESIRKRFCSFRNIDLSAKEVTDDWYEDIKSYDFDSCCGAAGSFTQLVWKETTDVGFGKSLSDGCCVVVAHYKPSGNLHQLYAANVFPPLTEFKDAKTAELVFHRDYKCKESKIDKKQSTEGNEQLKDNIVKECGTFSENIVNYHNYYRSLHGCRPLILNEELCRNACNWANYLLSNTHLSNSNYIYANEPVGENIAGQWANVVGQCGPQKIVKRWYEQGLQHNFTVEPTSIRGIGSFTQLVWANSSEIGVGKASSIDVDGTMNLVVVCFYWPAGNIYQRFSENVFPRLLASEC